MRIWIESAVRRLLNTKMPTEDVVGLPAQRQVGGVYVLPPWGMALNQKGFFFLIFIPQIAWKLAFQGITLFGL